MTDDKTVLNIDYAELESRTLARYVLSMTTYQEDLNASLLAHGFRKIDFFGDPEVEIPAGREEEFAKLFCEVFERHFPGIVPTAEELQLEREVLLQDFPSPGEVEKVSFPLDDATLKRLNERFMALFPEVGQYITGILSELTYPPRQASVVHGHAVPFRSETGWSPTGRRTPRPIDLLSLHAGAAERVVESAGVSRAGRELMYHSDGPIDPKRVHVGIDWSGDEMKKNHERCMREQMPLHQVPVGVMCQVYMGGMEWRTVKVISHKEGQVSIVAGYPFNDPEKEYLIDRDNPAAPPRK